jgi:magnesium-protoporphyrin O-methyltransferase
VAGCCNATDYRRFFNRKFAARDLRRYREEGLSKTARDLVELCGDVTGASVLEVGGGIGAVQLELLEAGARRSTNVELSGGYEDAAAELFAGRDTDRRIGDFVDEDIDPHDVVVMHRVVCCYPDVEALVGTAAARAQRRLALTVPQQRRWIGWGFAVLNVWLRLSRCGFRAYRHSFARIDTAAATKGLRLDERRPRGLLWESAAWTRLPEDAGMAE